MVSVEDGKLILKTKKVDYCNAFLSLLLVAVFSNTAGALPNASSINAENFSLSKISKPKSEFISEEDKINIPEGGRVTKGMDVPLVMKEINVYGFDAYKGRGGRVLTNAFNNALKSLSTARKKGNSIKPTIVRVDGGYKIRVEANTSLALAYELAQQLTTKYQEDKFFLSRVVVPAQEINDKAGVIELCAVEGFLSAPPSIELKEESKNLQSLKKTMGARLKGLVNLKPLSFDKFERELLLIRDLPGIDIKTVFQQVPEKKSNTNKPVNCKQALKNNMGATRLGVTLSLKKRGGVIGLDNYGTKAVGPAILRASVNTNSLFLAGDQYVFDIALSSDRRELKSYGLVGLFPVGLKGLILNVSHKQGNTAPGGVDFKTLEVDNKTTTSEIGLSYPLIRSRKSNLTLSGKLRYQNIKTNLLSRPFIYDKIRTLHGSMTYDYADKYRGINYLTLEMIKGISLGGATKKGSALSSRTEASGVFGKYKVEARRYQKLPFLQVGRGAFTWVNTLKMQYSNTPLLASEELELGGRASGRGFDVGVASGDKGLSFSTQLNYDVSLSNPVNGNLKVYGFLDHGRVWNLDVADKTTDQEKSRLTSGGIGFNFDSKSNWFLNAEVAKPISISGDKEKKKAKAYVGVGWRF